MQRLFIVIGIAAIMIGLLWPWLSRLGLGRLPGDIAIHKDGFHFYFPITTSVIVSVVISLILWFLRK